jgi:hypothetical protein
VVETGGAAATSKEVVGVLRSSFHTGYVMYVWLVLSSSNAHAIPNASEIFSF